MAGDGGRAPDVSEQRADPQVEAIAKAMWDFLADKQDDEGRGICRDGPVEPTGVRGGRLRWRAQIWEESDGAWRQEMIDLASIALSMSWALQGDPASVLAALLAEQPDATIAALETLLTNDEVVKAGAHAMRSVPLPNHMGLDASYTFVALAGACRSLRPKAPKEDRDA